MKTVFWILTIAVLLSPCIEARIQDEKAGRILEIRGDAYWMPAANTHPVKLNRNRDTGRTLYAGERLRCDRGGFLRLELYGKPLEISPSSEWTIIPHAVGDRRPIVPPGGRPQGVPSGGGQTGGTGSPSAPGGRHTGGDRSQQADASGREPASSADKSMSVDRSASGRSGNPEIYYILRGKITDAAVSAGAEQDLIIALLKYTEAFSGSTWPQLNTLLADDYISINAGGMVVTKAEEIKGFTALELEIRGMEIDDLKVRVYGDSAVVTDLERLRGRTADQFFNLNLRFTRVWVKREGEWRLVSSQFTEVPAPTEIK